MSRRYRLPLALFLLAGAALAYLRPWQRLVVVRQGGEGPPDLMLLHGERSTPAQLLPSITNIGLPTGGRILLPEAPHQLAPENGLPGGRVWWDLDLMAYRRSGSGSVDLTSLDPRGLERAAKRVLASLEREGSGPARPFVLGGFSQGALVACEVAFNSEEPLSALVLLSGTYVDSTGWGWKAANRRGLPVFIAHGRQDPVFPFEQAERLAQKLARGQGEGHPGVEVTFVPFEGGHEITPEVERALGHFLARLREAAWRKQAELAPPTPSNVRDLRDFPGGLPRCESHAGASSPLVPGLALIGQKVTFTGTLSLEQRRFCGGAYCETARCCNTCDIRFQIGSSSSGATVPIGRTLQLMDCETAPSLELPVLATGVLLLDEMSTASKPRFFLSQANLCLVAAGR